MGYINEHVLKDNPSAFELCFHSWCLPQYDIYQPIAECTYQVSQHCTSTLEQALLDCRANGIVAGEDCTWLGSTGIDQKVNIQAL